jgi:hypothetical protein
LFCRGKISFSGEFNQRFNDGAAMLCYNTITPEGKSTPEESRAKGRLSNQAPFRYAGSGAYSRELSKV